jgi:caffeoyl-CoA O-methyltransferase
MKKFSSIYKEDLEDWIQEKLTNRPSPLFLEVEAYALETRVPILSPATGEVLQYIVSKEKPKSILELGTGIGYSALWMLSSDLPLQITSWDRNPTCTQDAERFLSRYLKSYQSVHLETRLILETVRSLSNLEVYDCIFVDCDKVCYPELLSELPPKMKPNSLLLFDNVLWHGRLKRGVHNRPSDVSIQDFWDLVLSHHSRRTLFPVGDGLLLLPIEN